jgi:hypothetical protein
MLAKPLPGLIWHCGVLKRLSRLALLTPAAMHILRNAISKQQQGGVCWHAHALSMLLFNPLQYVERLCAEPA